MPKKITLPEFKSEREEADWWYANRDMISKEFRAAAEAGTLRFMTPEKIAERLRRHAAEKTAKPTLTKISLRIPETDLELARQQAEERGLAYQTYIKWLLHRALKKEEKVT